ncbi:rRNA methyltransferase 3A, mitochondrial isoform X1 [Narcine bancroftii]|uniref:rRNA methyltransferase 3A, mitochondrial isoform X1 n=1 Tax=Narcine bancroftii TaxID=1343680 RepID=UPI003831B118
MAALMGVVCRWTGTRLSPSCGPGRRYVRALRRRPIEIVDTRSLGASGTGERPGTGKRAPGQAVSGERAPGQAVSGERAPGQVVSGERAPSQAVLWGGDQGGQQAFGPGSLHGLSFERAIPGDKRLAKVMTIVKSKKFRDQHGKILLEGRRLITDALGAGASLETLFFSRVESLKELPLEKLKHVKYIKVKFDEIKMWSDLVTSQGAMGIFVKPEYSTMKYPVLPEHSIPLYLICDNIRDPGNLGTILRSAVAAGCSKVLLMKGCVDVWEPKVLRAGMGAHFRIPVISHLEWEVVPNYLTTSTCVHVADHCCPVAKSPPAPPQSLSASEAAREPTMDPAESDSEDKESSFPLSLPRVAAQSCYQPWARKQTAIVIGGETHGLSLEALLLAERTRGKRLYVPMSPGVESLNSAMAACILLFEGRRQLLFKGPDANRIKLSSK